jgi:hypothetical protein
MECLSFYSVNFLCTTLVLSLKNPTFVKLY